MKEHLKQLLIKSFDEDLSPKEQAELQKGFEDFPELLQEKEDILLLRNALQKQTYSFHFGFSDKIMRKIEASHSANEQNLQDYFAAQLSTLFRWIAPVGIAAIVLIVVALYFSEGSASFKTLIGANDFSFNDAVTLSFYNFK